MNNYSSWLFRNGKVSSFILLRKWPIDTFLLAALKSIIN